MDLEKFTKTRGDLFSHFARYFKHLRVAPTPAESIHEDMHTGFRLLRYKYRTDATTGQIKLLIVPHIINRPYILDLSDDVSVVQFFGRQGIEVFMIDWGYPETKHQEISFGHYAEYVNFAFGSMENEAPFVLGYCTGGIIALIWASLFSQKPKGLVLMATPVDFTDWRDPRLIWGKLFNVRQVADHFGNIPGELIDFIGMQLFSLYLPKLNFPVLNLYDRFDHIVPPESVRALGRIYTGKDYQEIDFPSSHAGLAASRKAQNHLWPQVADWLKHRGLN